MSAGHTPNPDGPRERGFSARIMQLEGTLAYYALKHAPKIVDISTVFECFLTIKVTKTPFLSDWKLMALLKPFEIRHFYTDGWGDYERHLEPEKHELGKHNAQKIERKHLTLRTRIKRLERGEIYFFRSVIMHNIIIGLFVNRYKLVIPI